MRNTVIIILSAIAASMLSWYPADAQDTGVGATAGLGHGEFDSYPDLTLTNMLQGKIAGLQVRSIVHGLGNNVPDVRCKGRQRCGSRDNEKRRDEYRTDIPYKCRNGYHIHDAHA